jgi:predicted PurR-regulated permease PerM
VLGQEQIAGLLALVCLLLAVVQIGPAVVLIGTVIYVFSTADTVTAVVFLIPAYVSCSASQRLYSTRTLMPLREMGDGS